MYCIILQTLTNVHQAMEGAHRYAEIPCLAFSVNASMVMFLHLINTHVMVCSAKSVFKFKVKYLFNFQLLW